MSHKYDQLAKKLTAPLWKCTRNALTDLRNWLTTPEDEMPRIKRTLANAEAFVRDALIQMASKLMVFPAKLRERTEGANASTPANPPEDRTPLFRLGLGRLEKPVGWMERSEFHQPEVPNETQSIDCASLHPSYTALEIIERKMAALEDVLASPGRHAARMKRALHKREDDSGDPFILKDPDTVLLDHIDHFRDDPEYSGTDAFRQLQSKYFDSS